MPAADPDMSPRVGRRAATRRAERALRRARTEFYASALDRTERGDLADAGDVAGLEQEIALLRLRLRRLLVEHPDDTTLMIRTIALLIRAVAASANLASADSTEVLDRVRAQIGGLLSLLNDDDGEADGK